MNIGLIIESFNKNWTLERKGSQPIFPIVGSTNNNNGLTPKVSVSFYYGKDTDTGQNISHEETYESKLPRVMAALMCEMHGIDRDESMLIMSIEQEEVWQRYIQAAKKILERSMVAKKERSKFDAAVDMPEDRLSLYRVYLKWHLCLNYINLHKPNEFFNERGIIEW